MCPPAVIAAASMAASIGGKIAQHNATNEAAAAVERSAREARDLRVRSLLEAETQTTEDAAQRIFLAERQAAQARSLAQAGSGEAGVAGASINALLDDIQRDAIEFRITTKRQEGRDLDALAREREAADVQMRNRIASQPRSSGLALGLGILSTGIQWAQFEVGRRPPADTTVEETTDG